MGHISRELNGKHRLEFSMLKWCTFSEIVECGDPYGRRE